MWKMLWICINSSLQDQFGISFSLWRAFFLFLLVTSKSFIDQRVGETQPNSKPEEEDHRHTSVLPYLTQQPNENLKNYIDEKPLLATCY